ncbi:FAD-dependent monooxygenase [Bowmanella dokdonensis]|uniref:FAD-dependent monooxygenase n=1 Tax=Bowmanella dokdonensis TaxID=751969 RepID=A0A939DLV2_9ALTE|nr:FAD-dependent monooxygenase [Bowmanella dokdonensis]MBN7825139.1 FAD-dependent monooxygenase [Bowmanella dokdonensis]
MHGEITKHEVVIAGAGPTGLMLGGELALAGVDVAIVERRIDQEVDGSRAGGLHPRTIEVLDQRGIAERFIDQGDKHYVVLFAGSIINASDRSTRHNYTLALWQSKIEHGLADWISGMGVPVYRGCEVTGFDQDESGVSIKIDNGRLLRAKYLVGCDGGRSLVRKQAGIDFPGWEPEISYLIFEADMHDEPILGLRYGERGLHALGKLEEGKRIRGVVTEQDFRQGAGPKLEDLCDALVAAYGTDYGIHNVTWLSRFTDAARQAGTYRSGRVLLAGDAAHVHSPVGGQGLNTGIHDAVNLGWKLAQVVQGSSPDSLLDTYHAERHPIGAQLLKTTLALTALNRGDERTSALREMMAKVMNMEEPRKWYAAFMSGLDIHYDLGDGHPLLGRRMPDLDLVTKDGNVRVFSFLHDARALLINLGKAGTLDVSPWMDRVRLVDARYDGSWQLPVLGEVEPPTAVLVRPDGHVAWVQGQRGLSLSDALCKWFGTPSIN